MIDAATRSFVRRRARDRCEYCLLGQEHDVAPFHIEHIIARQHGGSDHVSNLALACLHCNLHKGSNIFVIDSETWLLAPLYNPRADDWAQHLSIQGASIVGLTPAGRATVQVLAMNDRRQLDLRAAPIALGRFP